MWRRGDKAGCVWKKPTNDGLEVGRVYTVVEVGRCTCHGQGQAQRRRSGELILSLAELPPTHEERCPICGAPPGWLADRFRKVVEDKREAGEECPALLGLIKRKEKTDA
jgi:hypothetical protein